MPRKNMQQNAWLEFCGSLAVVLIAGNAIVFYVCFKHAQEQFQVGGAVDGTPFIITVFSFFIGCTLIVGLHYAKKRL